MNKFLTSLLIIIVSSIILVINVSADPLTIVKESYDYTTHTVSRSDGSRMVEFFSGPQFTQQDGGWVPIDKAKSLKGNPYYTCVIAEDDNTAAECLDYNLTSITLNISSKDNKNLNKVNDVYKIVNGTAKQKIRSMIFLTKDWEQTHVFNGLQQGQELHIGENSTIIFVNGTFQSNGKGGFVIDGDVAQKFNTNASWDAKQIIIENNDSVGSGNRWAYFLINLSGNITTNDIIQDANITLKESATGGSNTGGNLTLWNVTNYTWTTAMTWNTKFNGLNVINITDGVGDGGQATFNITSLVRQAQGSQNLMLSFMINETVNDGSNGIQHFESSNGTASNFISVAINFQAVNPSVLSNTAINISNLTLFTGDYFQTNVTVSHNQLSKTNLTAVLFINNVVNRTIPLNNDYANGTVVSYLWNNTNFTSGQSVVVQFNGTDGSLASNYINTTKVTINNSAPSISNIQTRTFDGYINNSYYFGQILDYINATVSDLESGTLQVNVTLYNANQLIINNQSMVVLSGSLYTNNTNITLNFNQTHTIRVDASDGILSSDLQLNFSVTDTVISSSEIHDSSTLVEGMNVTYIANFTLHQTILKDVSAFLEIDGVAYNATQTQNVSGASGWLLGFMVNTTVPLATSNPQVKQLRWNYTIDFTNGNSSNRAFSNFTQSVSAIIGGLCNSTLNVPFINFSFKEEFNHTNLSENFGATFVVWMNGSSVNRSFSIAASNKSSVAVCLSPAHRTFLSDAIIQYDAVSYDARDYFLYRDPFSNLTQNISLYSLQIALATETTFNIFDEVDVAIPDAYVIVERYEPGTNKSYVMTILRTDDEGKATTFLRWSDALYQVAVDMNGSLQRVINRSLNATYRGQIEKIIESPRTINILPLSFSAVYDTFKDIIYTLTNTTSTISVQYDDVLGRTTMNCLTAVRIRATGDQRLGQVCSSNRSGTLVISYTNITGSYLASYYTNINPTIPVGSISFSIADSIARALGATGPLLAFFVIAFVGFVGLEIGLLAAVGFPLLALFAFIIAGFLQFNPITYVGIFIVGIIIIVKGMKSG